MNVCFVSTAWVREKEILKELNKKVNLLFICPYLKDGNYNTKEVIDYCQENKINFIINDFTNRRARSLSRVIYDLCIVRKIVKFKPDIVYLESLVSPYFAIYSRLLLGSKRTIISIMDYKLHQRSKGQFKFSEQFYRFIQLTFYKNFQFFSFSQEKLFKKDHPNKNSSTIRLFLVGSDLSKDNSKVKGTCPNFLFFGRIFYYKGVDTLIKATNIVAEKRSDFKVTIAGGCSNWETDYLPLIKHQDRFDLKIRFIEKSELPEIFQRADFFVTPYREVTQSGPLLRAYYYDLIPIVSDEDGFTEYVIDGQSGIVFKKESEESLALAMERALELTSLQRGEINQNISNFKSKEFDLDRVIGNYIKLFTDTVTKKKRKK